MRGMKIFAKNRLETSVVFAHTGRHAGDGKQVDIITCEYPPSLG